MPSYRFTGYARTGYMAYRDLGTGLVLIAEPGGVYEMQSVTLSDPVPPSDGRWETVPDSSAPEPPMTVVIPPPPPSPEPPAAPDEPAEPPAGEPPAE